jgi:hypothetical protein
MSKPTFRPKVARNTKTCKGSELYAYSRKRMHKASRYLCLTEDGSMTSARRQATRRQSSNASFRFGMPRIKYSRQIGAHALPFEDFHGIPSERVYAKSLVGQQASLDRHITTPSHLHRHRGCPLPGGSRERPRFVPSGTVVRRRDGSIIGFLLIPHHRCGPLWFQPVSKSLRGGRKG